MFCAGTRFVQREGKQPFYPRRTAPSPSAPEITNALGACRPPLPPSLPPAHRPTSPHPHSTAQQLSSLEAIGSPLFPAAGAAHSSPAGAPARLPSASALSELPLEDEAVFWTSYLLRWSHIPRVQNDRAGNFVPSHPFSKPLSSLIATRAAHQPSETTDTTSPSTTRLALSPREECCQQMGVCVCSFYIISVGVNRQHFSPRQTSWPPAEERLLEIK